jgi:hypothetical protein
MQFGGEALVRKLMLILAAGLCVQSVATPGFAQANSDSPLCPDREDWTRNAALTAYFRDHYYEFDLYGGAFISAGGRSDRVLSEPLEERIRVGTVWHDRILGIIYRLGRLLPRFSRPMDLPPMIHQAETGVVKDPDTGEYVEFLRVALVRDMLAVSDDAGATIATFLKDLDALEGQTDAIRDGEITADQLHTYYETLKQAEISRKAFRAILKQVIFSDDLHDRMSARLAGFCGNADQP